MTASTDWQQGVNWMTKASVASTSSTGSLILRNEPHPLFFSSCMWAACPVPNRRTGTSWREGRRERESWVDTHLPSSTIRWRPGGRKPQREPFHRATRFFREALSQTFPLLPPQAKRFQDQDKIPGDQVKVNSPEQIFYRAYPLFLLFLSSKKNINIEI